MTATKARRGPRPEPGSECPDCHNGWKHVDGQTAVVLCPCGAGRAITDEEAKVIDAQIGEFYMTGEQLQQQARDLAEYKGE